MRCLSCALASTNCLHNLVQGLAVLAPVCPGWSPPHQLMLFCSFSVIPPPPFVNPWSLILLIGCHVSFGDSIQKPMNLASSPALLPLTLRDLSSSRPYCCENFISSKKCKNDREQKQIRCHISTVDRFIYAWVKYIVIWYEPVSTTSLQQKRLLEKPNQGIGDNPLIISYLY